MRPTQRYDAPETEKSITTRSRDVARPRYIELTTDSIYRNDICPEMRGEREIQI